MLRNNVLIFLKSMIMVQLFFIVLLTGVSLDINRIIWQENSFVNRLGDVAPEIRINLNEDRAETLLRQVNVALTGTNQWPWQESTFLSWTLPRQLMASNIQVLASADMDVSGNEELDAQPGTFDLPAIVQTDSSSSLTPEETQHLKGRQVALYCTHSAETYTPDSGKAKLDGKHGLINDVARQIADSLQQQGLKTAYYNKIHDFPEYDKSYTNSRETVKRIIKEQDQLLALFDIHRDNIPGMAKAETVTIDGKPSARILIIVGSDERKPHPDWEKNLDFANRIAEHGEQMYPGLIKGVRIKAGTYNQEYHHGALLVEVGSDLNSLAEARYAAELFSDILIRVLAEELS